MTGYAHTYKTWVYCWSNLQVKICTLCAFTRAEYLWKWHSGSSQSSFFCAEILFLDSLHSRFSISKNNSTKSMAHIVDPINSWWYMREILILTVVCQVTLTMQVSECFIPQTNEILLPFLLNRCQYVCY